MTEPKCLTKFRFKKEQNLSKRIYFASAFNILFFILNNKMLMKGSD